MESSKLFNFVEKGPDIKMKGQSYSNSETLSQITSSQPISTIGENVELYCSLIQLQERLRTDFQTGLPSTDIEYRDKNELIYEQPQSDLQIFFKEFNYFTYMLLFTCAICLGIVIHGLTQSEFNRTEASLLLLLITLISINSILAFQQRKKTINSYNHFKNLTPEKCKVIRDDILVSINVSDIVIGDVIELVEGSVIPADLRVVESNNMKVDNSIITGDKDPIQATVEITGDSSHILYYGCAIREGAGKGVVIHTAQNSIIGKIQKINEKKRRKLAPIKQEVQIFQKFVCFYLISSNLIILILALILSNFQLYQAFKIIVKNIIATIPEGLSLSITISISMATRRLGKRSYLVKSEEVIESLSQVNCLCVGLQGVITDNRFEYSNSWHSLRQVSLMQDSFTVREMYNCCVFTSDNMRNNLSQFQSLQTQDLLMQTYNQTERALILGFKYIRNDQEAVLNMSYAFTEHGMQFKIPFSSNKKYSICVVQINGRFIAYVKGAPEIVWGISSKIQIDELQLDINYGNEAQYKEYILEQSQQGKRLIGFAFRYLDKFQANHMFRFHGEDFEFPMTDFCFLGVMSLKCHLRKDVQNLVHAYRDANIKIVVMTGESYDTAKMLCQQSGILTEPTVDDLIQKGMSYQQAQLEAKAIIIDDSQLSLEFDHTEAFTSIPSMDLKLAQICKYSQVIVVRIKPERKSLIVRACRKLRYKVAVGGQNLVDLESFRQADVAVASEFSSSISCLRSCDVSLNSPDQSFLNLFDAIIEARRAVANIFRTILFCLSSNSAKVVAFLTYIIFQAPEALSSILMLVICCVNDVLIGVSFAREPLEVKLPQRQYLFDKNKLFWTCAVIGVIESAACLITFYTTMMFFGFRFSSMQGIDFTTGFNATNQIYNASSPFLGNTLLPNLNSSLTPTVCIPKMTYTKSIPYVWGTSAYNRWDQRLMFVVCGNCTQEQLNAGYQGAYCWNSIKEYLHDCEAENYNLGEYCYQGLAEYYGKTSFYMALVFCQICNYFAMRTSWESYAHSHVNYLSIYCMIGSVILGFAFIYVPGVQDLLETIQLPWILLGQEGIPIMMLIIVVAEIKKYLIRKTSIV